MSVVMSGRATVTDARVFENAVFEALTSSDNGGAILCTETGTVTISGSTFSSDVAANAGGAVFIAGVSTITGSKFLKNTAIYGGACCIGGSYTSEISEVSMQGNTANMGGAIYNAGLIFAEDITLKANAATVAGGAVYNEGMGTVSESVFVGNQAAYGGAFMNIGLFTITNNEFASNSASTSGGALYNGSGAGISVTGSSFSTNTASSYGGAIANFGGSVGLANAELKGNTAGIGGGALFLYLGESTVTGTTFTSNEAKNLGGAVYHLGGTASSLLKEDVFISNTASYGAAVYSETGTIVIQGCTFSKNNGKTYGGAIDNDATVEISNSSFSGNKSICGGAVFNNGGIAGVTASHFNNGSGQYGAAIFNADGTLSLADSVLSGNTCSTGGAIYNELGTTSITGSLFSGNMADGGGAIYSYFANMTISGSTFSSNTVGSLGGAIAFTGTTVALTVSDTEFNANNAVYGAASFLETGTADFSHVSFLENLATYTGGAIYNAATTSISNSQISGNLAAYGAGIANFNSMAVTASTFTGNYSSVFGSAFYNVGGKIEITGSEFSKNIAGQAGGAMYHAGTVSGSIESSTFSDNLSAYGGALVNYGPLRLANCILSGNTAAGDGGALYNYGGALLLSGSTMSGNTAASLAGVLYTALSDQCTISGCSLENNIALYGGCFMVDSGVFSIADSTISANIGTVSGGVIYNNSATVAASGATFTKNESVYGGVIMNTGTALASLKDSVLSGNTAWLYGGVINNSATVSSENSTFTDNFSTVGGVIRNDATACSIVRDSDFNGNTASFGGVIYNEGSASLYGSSIIKNKGTVSGGAVYNAGNFLCDETNIEENISGYGAVFNAGTANISNAVFRKNISNYAGAIYNCGTAAKMVLNDVLFDGNEAFYGGAILNEANLTLGNATFSDNFAFNGSAVYNTGIITITGKISLESASENICNYAYIYVDASKFDLSNGYALVVDGVQAGWRTGFRIEGNQEYGFVEVGTDGYLVARKSLVMVKDTWSEKSFGDIVLAGYTYGINAFATADAAAGAVMSGGTISNSSGNAVFSYELSDVTLNSAASYIKGSQVYMEDVSCSGILYCSDSTVSETAESKWIKVSNVTSSRLYLGESANNVVQTGNTASVVAEIDNFSGKGLFCAGNVVNATVLESATVSISASTAGLLFGGVNTKGTSADALSPVVLNGDKNITLNNVVSDTYVCGGSLIGSYSSESATGNITLNISGGTYQNVIGGSLLQSMVNVSSEITGNVNISVTGKTEISTLYGGSFALKVGPTRKETITGDINITIDVSEGASVSGKVFCGGVSYVAVDGDVNLTIKGAGSGSDFFGATMISCDSSYAKGNQSYITGDRALSFNNFNGRCLSNIFLVDTINVDATSEVTLTYLMSHLDGVNWNISADDADRDSVTFAESTLGEFAIDLAGSEMHLSCELDDGDEWTVFKTAGNEVLSNLNNAIVYLNDDLLTETDINILSGDTYQLEYREDGSLVASKLA